MRTSKSSEYKHAIRGGFVTVSSIALLVFPTIAVLGLFAKWLGLTFLGFIFLELVTPFSIVFFLTLFLTGLIGLNCLFVKEDVPEDIIDLTPRKLYHCFKNWRERYKP